ncbi:hypothetical protein R6Q59_022192 [Mikania micrantha]
MHRHIPSKHHPINPGGQRNNNRRLAVVHCTGEEQQKPTATESEATAETSSELGTEIKNAMMDREVKEEEGLWSGVAAEIGRIEWPAFNKVVGTTGVVLGVSSHVVLFLWADFLPREHVCIRSL